MGAATLELREVDGAIFLDSPGLGPDLSLLSLASSIVSRLGDLNAQPIILPIPPDAPPEVPRIMLQNRPGSLNCTCTAQRIDLKATRLDAEPLALSQFEPQLLSLLDGLGGLKLKVIRLGLVISGDVHLGEDAVSFVRTHFLTGGKFDDPQALEASVLRQGNACGETVNHWLRIYSGGDIPRPVLRIMVDLNTVANRKEEISIQSCRSYFKEFISMVQVPVEELIGIA